MITIQKKKNDKNKHLYSGFCLICFAAGCSCKLPINKLWISGQNYLLYISTLLLIPIVFLVNFSQSHKKLPFTLFSLGTYTKRRPICYFCGVESYKILIRSLTTLNPELENYCLHSTDKRYCFNKTVYNEL